MVTIFKNLSFAENNNPHYISVDKALQRIKDGTSKDTVLKIRELKSKGQNYDKEKKSLACVVYGGECREEITKKNKDGREYKTRRVDDSVTVHSGFFVLDFDDCNGQEKKLQLRQDSYIYAAWISPSGGCKALVRCPKDIVKHKDYYDSFCDRYPELDTTSRNIARLCFESYDPDIWRNTSSKVWDKVKTTEQQKTDYKTSINQRKGKSKISIAVDMVRSSVDGDKHETLLKASKLLGGYVATGYVDENEAVSILRQEIEAKNPKDINNAYKTIDDGIAYGKASPLKDIKQIEKKYDGISKRPDGEFDFIARKEDMDEYLQAYIDGTLEMGLSTGIPNIDNHWMIKRHHLVWFGGLDNVGKSFVVWYLAVLASLFHGWKFLLFSAENNDGQVRKKLIEFVLGESVKRSSQAKIEKATKHIDYHFKIVSNKSMFTWEEILLRAELVFDEGWYFDCFIAEPYNAMDIPSDLDNHRHNLKALNMLRTFKENYSTVWVADHANSFAGRDKDPDTGHIRRPWKASIDGGQLKNNKVDDFVVLHRIINEEALRMQTQFHVDKIKDVETGGRNTTKENFPQLTANNDLCGFTNAGVDPIAQWWLRREEQSSMKMTPNLDFLEE